MPIILSGWWYTPAIAKWIAWQATEQWAAERQVSHLIPDLPASEWASVFEASGIVMHEYHHHEPASVPSKELLADSMDQLEREWRLVAEPFADHTLPIAFTGRKGRRLLVEADFGILPPWGSWTKLVDRKAFTVFRQKVNEAIAPHRVDHIDFRRQRTKATL